jgi:predicted ATPase
MPASPNLPQQVTTFVGREREVTEIQRLLEGHDLVSLIGPAGAGKTRLAIEVAGKRADRYANGVCYVNLGLIADPSLASQAFASSLGVQEKPGQPVYLAVADHLADKDLLLVVDLAPHVLEQAKQLCELISRECPNVQLLVVGRDPLGLKNERTFQVPSLSLPDPKAKYSVKKLEEFEAVRLFVDRATQSDPEFQVSRENGRTIARICSYLDGIPLAIELAAALVGTVPLGELADKLTERFIALTEGGTSFMPRTQTLRAMIGWSYEQLGEYEQKLLRRLSVFVNGWRLEAAFAVCADEEGGGMQPIDVEDFLETLVDRGLVQHDRSAGRYSLIESVRGFARDALDETLEADSIRDKHLEYFRDLCQSAEVYLDGPEAKGFLEQLDEERDNLRGAIEWGQKSGNLKPALELAVSLASYFQVRGLFEEGAATYASLVRQAPEGEDALVARALAHQAVLLFKQGQFGLTRQVAGRALQSFEKVGDQRGMAFALNTLAAVALLLEEFGEARVLFERALSLFRQVGEEARVAMTLNNLGIVAVHLEDLAGAQALYEEALEVNKRTGNRRLQAGNLTNLADLSLKAKNGARARQLAQEACLIHLELRDHQNLQDTFEALAAAELMCGRPYMAAILFANKEVMLTQLGTSVAPFVADEYRANVEAARRALGEETYRAAFTEGRAMSPEDAVRASLEDF